MESNEARESLIKGCYHKLSICETLRRTYDLVADLPDKELKKKITDKLVEAITMARKMSNRLVYYRTTYNDQTGHNSSNLRDATDYTEVKAMREKRSLEHL